MLHGDDSRIGGQRRAELTRAHVHRVDLPRAAAQQHVGEAAGGRANVHADQLRGIRAEHPQRLFQLQAAAADVGVIRAQQLDGVGLRDFRRGLGAGPAVDGHQPGANERLRALPAGAEPAGGQRHIQTKQIFRIHEVPS